MTRLLDSILHFILFVFACIDEDRRRKLKTKDFIKKQIKALLEEQQQQVQKPGALSQDMPPGMVLIPFVVPPGMALVPNEVLAQLNQPLPTYYQQIAE